MTKETELAIFQHIQPLQIFQENKGDDFLAGVEKEVEEFKKTRDISTPKGRAEIKSFSYKISQTKTPVDKAGLNLTEEARDKINKINAERKRVKERLQFFQDDVRKPFTDFEDKQKEHIEVRQKRIEEIEQLKIYTVASVRDSIQIQAALIELDNLIKFDWQEFQGKADNCYNEKKAFLKSELERVEKREQEQAELEKLRKEKEEREKKDREEQLRREAEARTSPAIEFCKT